MPIHLDDRETTELVAMLATRLQTSEQDAVKTAVRAELQKLDSSPSFKDKLEACRARHPRLVPTRQPADEQFFDMGDCFAYACVKSIGARLLYKGNDFARTDLA